MSHRRVVLAAVFAALITGPALMPIAGQGQGSVLPYAPPPSAYAPPKTPWGDPDLQGTYDYQSLLPLQRPAQFAGKATFTDLEYEEFWRNNTPSFDTQAGSALSNLP